MSYALGCTLTYTRPTSGPQSLAASPTATGSVLISRLTDTTTVLPLSTWSSSSLATSPMPSQSKPFAGRRRVADLTAGSVFELRTEAVLRSAAPIPIESIDPNLRNPRQAVPHDEAFGELVESIRQHRLLQPVLVRSDGVRRILDR